MGEHRRRADGRRVFSTDFKWAAVHRVMTEKTVFASLADAQSRIEAWRIDYNQRRPHDLLAY